MLREIGMKLAKLIDVKSLVTLALVGVLCGMTIAGQETSELFNSAAMLVLGFFFGKKTDDAKQPEALQEVQTVTLDEIRSGE